VSAIRLVTYRPILRAALGLPSGARGWRKIRAGEELLPPLSPVKCVEFDDETAHFRSDNQSNRQTFPGLPTAKKCPKIPTPAVSFLAASTVSWLDGLVEPEKSTNISQSHVAVFAVVSCEDADKLTAASRFI